MNQADAIACLKKELTGFAVHNKMVQELAELLKSTSQRERVVNMLIRRLRFLRDHGNCAPSRQPDLFEALNGQINSLHVSVKELNLRVLYSFLDDGTILLSAFHERSGKRNTDYTHQIPVAERRLREWREENGSNL